jgi:hypothetical protein
LSIRDYLHEKAEESRHNEMFAYLMFIAGAIFFIGGVLETVTTTSNPDWFLFFPYHVTSQPYSILGLALTLSGIALLVYGVGMGIYHAHDRAWYMQELYKAHSIEASSMGGKKRRKRNGIKTSVI